jgi:hypothetical protein
MVKHSSLLTTPFKTSVVLYYMLVLLLLLLLFIFVNCKEYLKTTNVHTALGATSKKMLNPDDNTDTTSTAQFLDKRRRNLNAFCLCYFCCLCRCSCSDQECIITETTDIPRISQLENNFHQSSLWKLTIQELSINVNTFTAKMCKLHYNMWC